MDRDNRAEQCISESKGTQCVTNKEVLWSREAKYQQNIMWGLKDEGDGTVRNEWRSVSGNTFLYSLGSTSPKILIVVTTG